MFDLHDAEPDVVTPTKRMQESLYHLSWVRYSFSSSTQPIKMMRELARRAFAARNYAGDVIYSKLYIILTITRTYANSWFFLLSTDALQLYVEALKLTDPPSQQQQQQQQCSDPPEWAVLASNISAVLLKLYRPEDALEYATAAAQVCMTFAMHRMLQQQ
jgi:hypothetical protein